MPRRRRTRNPAHCRREMPPMREGALTHSRLRPDQAALSTRVVHRAVARSKARAWATRGGGRLRLSMSSCSTARDACVGALNGVLDGHGDQRALAALADPRLATAGSRPATRTARSCRCPSRGRHADHACYGAGLVGSVAVDATSVYWTNAGTMGSDGAVLKVPIGGGPPVTLASGQYVPQGIALDGANVYWTDYASSRVRKTPKSP